MARIVFFGTPALAAPTLRALVHAGHDIALVITQPDRRRGRGNKVEPSPVKAAALELGLPVTSRVKDALTVEADLGVLVAFGRLIKREILDLWPIINLHPSLLPRWRGATPVEGAILGGDTVTGMSLMQLAEEMDAGPIYAQVETPMEPDETSEMLYERLFTRGNELLVDLLLGPLPEPVAQVGEPTFCGKLTPDDFHIDWSQSAEVIARLTRVGRPWTTFRGKRLKIVHAVLAEDVSDLDAMDFGSLSGTTVATGKGNLILRTVQPEGKGPMDANAWANGARPAFGELLI